jgi:hypothetical protein
MCYTQTNKFKQLCLYLFSKMNRNDVNLRVYICVYAIVYVTSRTVRRQLCVVMYCMCYTQTNKFKQLCLYLFSKMNRNDVNFRVYICIIRDRLRNFSNRASTTLCVVMYCMCYTQTNKFKQLCLYLFSKMNRNDVNVRVYICVVYDVCGG